MYIINQWQCKLLNCLMGKILQTCFLVNVKSFSGGQQILFSTFKTIFYFCMIIRIHFIWTMASWFHSSSAINIKLLPKFEFAHAWFIWHHNVSKLMTLCTLLTSACQTELHRIKTATNRTSRRNGNDCEKWNKQFRES